MKWKIATTSSFFVITELALKAYTEHRNPDAKAIVDLAMYNYVEVNVTHIWLKVENFEKRT